MSVQSSPCCSFPFFSSSFFKTEAKGDSQSLKERVCADWRVIPAFAALTMCIMGIVLCVMWRSYYVTIPFAIGAAGATYMLYLAYQYRYLQSLEITSKVYTDQTKKFKDENSRLQGAVSSLTEQNKTLESSLKKQEELSTKQKEEIEKFSAENAKLNEKIENLDATLQRCQEAMTIQQQLLESLKLIQEAMEKDHKALEPNVKTLEKVVVNTSELQKSAQENSAVAKELVQNLNHTGEALQGIFAKLLAWKDDQSVQKTIETLQTLDATLKDKIKELGQIEGQISILENQVTSLKGLQSRLSQNVGDLQKQVERFSKENDRLEKPQERPPRRDDDDSTVT